MSTNSFIGKIEKNGTITGISCHWDGDIEHNGKLLAEYYTTRDKVDELIALGNLSVLGPAIGHKINLNNEQEYSAHMDKQCIAYHRDRNDVLEIHTNENLTELCECYPYVYIYTKLDDWLVYYDEREQMLYDALELYCDDKTSEIKNPHESNNEQNGCMIKIIVTELPEKPEDCPFAIRDSEYYSKCGATLANCSLKHNDSLRNPRKTFSYTHNSYTCNPKVCPFLTTK